MVEKMTPGRVFPCQYHSTLAVNIYIICGMNNRPVGGCSSETQSHHIDMNTNNNIHLKTTYIKVRFWVLTAISMKTHVIWDVALFSMVDINNTSDGLTISVINNSFLS
jgi:hypothetical protein